MQLGTRRVVLVVAVGLLLGCSGAWAQSTQTGVLPAGATYLTDVPSDWKGILFLYGHGYVVPGSKNPAQDVGDPATP